MNRFDESLVAAGDAGHIVELMQLDDGVDVGSSSQIHFPLH